jgi:hypothetical protein
MNANEFPGPSTTVLVFDGIPPEEEPPEFEPLYDGDGAIEGVGVGVVVLPPLVLAEALLPHATATRASAVIPIRSPRLLCSTRIS